MCHKLFGAAKLFEALVHVDEDLHRAHYPRKPRGVPPAHESDYTTRLSFCCARDGCRRRTTPASVRFLGRRVYVGVIVALVCALEHGVNAARLERLRTARGGSLDRRTVERWRTWWRETFVRSAFWNRARARFAPAVDARELPRTLLRRFGETDERTTLERMLAFLAPITTTSA